MNLDLEPVGACWSLLEPVGACWSLLEPGCSERIGVESGQRRRRLLGPKLDLGPFSRSDGATELNPQDQGLRAEPTRFTRRHWPLLRAMCLRWCRQELGVSVRRNERMRYPLFTPVRHLTWSFWCAPRDSNPKPPD